MKRVLLDTNIYGRVVERSDEEVQTLAEKRKDIVIYGFDVVRKELRAVSKDVKHGKKKVRLALLALYDSLVKSHIYGTTSPIRQLAGEYFKAYKELGGRKSEKEILNDFMIVACASIHELDIVVSEDNKTMLSDSALKAYRIVNSLRKYRTPQFIGYEDFRRLFSL